MAIKYFTIACAVIGVLLAAKWFVMPRLLRALLGVHPGADGPRRWRDRVELRYLNLHTSVWMFSWFKLRLDPMFTELPRFLDAMPNIRTALDLGCGYGVAGSSLLEWNADLKLYGMDPNPKRVLAASRAFGERGEVFHAGAPDFEVPGLPGRLDAVFVLDVIHYLSDPALDLTLSRIRARMDEGGYLVIRAPMLPEGFGSLTWKIDRIRRLLTGAYACYRNVDQVSAAIVKAGFQINQSEISGKNPELHWFLAVGSSPEESSRLRVGSELAHASQDDDKNNHHRND